MIQEKFKLYDDIQPGDVFHTTDFCYLTDVFETVMPALPEALLPYISTANNYWVCYNAQPGCKKLISMVGIPFLIEFDLSMVRNENAYIFTPVGKGTEYLGRIQVPDLLDRNTIKTMMKETIDKLVGRGELEDNLLTDTIQSEVEETYFESNGNLVLVNLFNESFPQAAPNNEEGREEKVVWRPSITLYKDTLNLPKE